MDDVVITGDSLELIQQVKHQLDNKFTIKDLGFLKYFLGLEVAISSASTFISQCKFITDLVSEIGLDAAKPSSFPLPKGLHLHLDEGVILSALD